MMRDPEGLAEAVDLFLISWERWDTQCLRRGGWNADASYPAATVTAKAEEHAARVAKLIGASTSAFRARLQRERAAGATREEAVTIALDDPRLSVLRFPL